MNKTVEKIYSLFHSFIRFKRMTISVVAASFYEVWFLNFDLAFMSALCAIFTVANAKLVPIKILFMPQCESVHWITIECVQYSSVLDMKWEKKKKMNRLSEGQEFLWLLFLLFCWIFGYTILRIVECQMIWILNLRWKVEKTWHDEMKKKTVCLFLLHKIKYRHLMFDVFKFLNYCFVLVFDVYSCVCVWISSYCHCHCQASTHINRPRKISFLSIQTFVCSFFL